MCRVLAARAGCWPHGRAKSKRITPRLVWGQSGAGPGENRRNATIKRVIKEPATTFGMGYPSKKRNMTHFRQLAIVLLLASAVAWGQTPNKRLILKDGSYQITRQSYIEMFVSVAFHCVIANS